MTPTKKPTHSPKRQCASPGPTKPPISSVSCERTSVGCTLQTMEPKDALGRLMKTILRTAEGLKRDREQ